MAEIIVLTSEAKKCLQILLFNEIQKEPDNDELHKLYNDVVNTKK